MATSEDAKSAFWIGFVLGFISLAILVFVVTHYVQDRREECKQVDGVNVCRTITYGDWKVK